MSHDFAFWESVEPLEDREAGEIFACLLRDGSDARIVPSARISPLARDIDSLWPRPGVGREDDWPLASPADVLETHLLICLVPSRLWDVWPTLGHLAERHELVMYDPQQEHIFLPLRLSRKRTRLRAKAKRHPGP